ncbi:sel1 repeat family protein [archaeon]|nr:MAG: sel1 repeat family protein [archaeon]
MFNLGICYEEGLGVCRDYPQVVSWYAMAAKRGHVLALS